MNKNYVFNFITTISKAAQSFIILIIFSNFFPDSDVGDYALAVVWSTILINILDFGFLIIMPVKLGSLTQIKKDELYDINSAKLTLLLPTFLFFLLSLTIYPGNIFVYLLVFLSFVVNNLFSFLITYFRGLERFDNEAYVSFIFNLFVVIIAYFLSQLSFSIIQILIICNFIRIISLVIIAFHKDLNSYFMFGNPKNSIESNYVAFLVLISGSLYFLMDSIIMGFYLDAERYKAYQIGIQIVLVASIFSNSISNIMMHIFSKNKILGMSKKTIIATMLVSILLALIAFILIWFLDDILFKVSFSNNEIILISLIIFMRVFLAPYGAFLSSRNKNYLRFKLNFSTMLISFMFCYLLIYVFGVSNLIGYFSSFATHLILFFMYVFIFFKRGYFEKSN